MDTLKKLAKYYNYKYFNSEHDFVNLHIKNFLNYDKILNLPFDKENYNLLVKLYIIVYFLKKQFKIVLGELGKDFEVYTGSKEDWNFKVCNDSYVFYNTPKITIKVNKINHFFTDCCILGSIQYEDNDYNTLNKLLKDVDNEWITNIDNLEDIECVIRHLIKKANVKQVNEVIKSSNYYVRDTDFENTMNYIVFYNEYRHIYVGYKLPLDYKYQFTEDRKYNTEEIIEVCINAKKLLTKYKTYLSNVGDFDTKLQVYRSLEKRLEFYNDMLYCALRSVFYKEDYSNFRSKNVILPKNKVLQDFIPYPHTLKQINFVNKKYLDEIMKKNKLLKGFNQVYEPSKNDIEIYMELQDKLESSKEDVDRGAIRVGQTQELLNQFKNKNVVYVDFGGSDGTISSALTKYMNINKEKSFSVDVENWFNISNIEKYPNITYKRIKENTKLPFEDNSVDFITCFQVLHHIKNHQFIINEFRRILKNDGIVLLREHDCRNREDHTLIDIEHSVNEITQRHLDRCNAEKFLNDYEAYYQSRDYWIKAFKDFERISFRFTGEIKGPTRYYYEVFRK
jgi:SAM-dependent methyltransferase